AHVAQSTDGQCTRVYFTSNGASRGLWIFDAPRAPVSGWTNPWIAFMKGEVANSLEYPNATVMCGSAGSGTLQCFGRIAGASASLVLSAEGVVVSGLTNSGVLSYSLLSGNDFTGRWELGPLGVVGITAGARGRHARMWDLWLASSANFTGNTYP